MIFNNLLLERKILNLNEQAANIGVLDKVKTTFKIGSVKGTLETVKILL